MDEDTVKIFEFKEFRSKNRWDEVIWWFFEKMNFVLNGDDGN